MPYKSRKPCKHPHCGELVEAGVGYCPKHRKQHNKREMAHLYDSKWRKISKLYLSRNPLCEQCQREGRLTPAVECHHIIPLADGGGHTDENLMGLCKACHSRIEGNLHK